MVLLSMVQAIATHINASNIENMITLVDKLIVLGESIESNLKADISSFEAAKAAKVVPVAPVAPAVQQ